jgi:hypothetical protein
VLPDPHLAELPAALERIRTGAAGHTAAAGHTGAAGHTAASPPSVFDLGAAGVAVELARLPEGAGAAFASGATFDARLVAERRAIHGSLSFRLGRAITAPGRWLRAAVRGGGGGGSVGRR